MPANEPQTKAQRRDAARAEALALREAQLKRDRRNRFITIGALVVGLAVLIGVFLWFFIPALNDQNDAADATASGDLTAVDSPSTAGDDGGIPMGADGVAGTDNGADAVEVGVYLDYMCPICGDFEESNGATLDQLRESGDVTVVLHPVAILDRAAQSKEYSTRAASAAGFVADRAPEALSDFNAILFANQPEEGTATLTDEQIADLAEQAGVPSDVAGQIADGTARDEFGAWAGAATTATTQNPDLMNPQSGGFGTPTITIGGVRWDGNWSDPSALPQAVADAASGDGAASDPEGTTDEDTEGKVEEQSQD
ncbi:DsbA family protein [Cellulosimicrobium arenosum]|uniref:Thioredoxin domain-containing protein n=1 Tax=Cellulosimicrobium arenosum TaxID=2708133 RepID=A0A927G9F2_9MICO|nr:thioredoxin domain-containing protein [Cellulosimicrobium arenosum]MBD8079085.1 thioredoxin domain-containing protein [Cellulosimicrobium arenosum]